MPLSAVLLLGFQKNKEECFMAEILNPSAYFKAVLRNSYNDEQRADGIFHDHTYSVGDESDIQRVWASQERNSGHNEDAIDLQLCDDNTENWLLLMEDERLCAALRGLSMDDVGFLLELSILRFDQITFAASHGVTKQAVSQRKKRIFAKIRKVY
jgi:hypothetical protein